MTALLVAAVLAVSQPKPVLTVLYFDNNTGQAGYDVLRKGLADMIISDLVAWDGVAVVEREKLQSVMGELKLQGTKSFDASTAVKLGKLVGAQYLLTGSMAAANAELRLDAKLIRAQDASVAASATVKGDKDKVFELEQELVDKLTLGIDLKVKNVAARRKAKVPDLETLLAYSGAIDLSDQGKMEEAQKAMQQVVSKSPSFLLAREKKEQILKQLEERFEKRRADMVTGSTLELGRLADAALADEGKLDSLDEKAQRRLLSMRMVKANFLVRLLKQHLSWRRDHLRLILKGHEVQALQIMHAWLENQRRLVEEQERFSRQRGNQWPTTELEPEVQNLLRDARMGTVVLSSDHVEALASFVVTGGLRDGEKSFTVAPALGDLEPKEQQAAFELLDARIADQLAAVAKAEPAKRSAAEGLATRRLEAKAGLLLALNRVEDAIGQYQRILDAFPSGQRSDWVEHRIKQLIGAEHDDSRGKRELWAKALRDGCANEMDLRISSSVVMEDRLRRAGLAGLAVHAAELEKACKVTHRNRGGFASVYRDSAIESAFHEDCEGFRSWFKRYVEADGSIGDMMGYAKNWTPWCELGDVTRSVLWMTAALDQNWSIELDRNLTSVLSHDGKQLSLLGGKESSRESLSLYLDAAGPNGFRCRQAQWHRLDTSTMTGTCTVSLTKLAADVGEVDEGEFTASFPVTDEPGRKPLELANGKFRLRRR